MERNKLKFFEKRIYLVLLIASIFLFFASQEQFVKSDRLWPDEALYSWYADNIHKNPAFIFSKELSYPPLVPLILSLSNYFLSPETAYKFTALIISSIGLLLCFFLGKKIHSKFTGIASSMIAGFSLVYYFQATFILLDMPSAVLSIVLALSLLHVRPSSGKIFDHVLVGISIAALLLTKMSGIIFVPILLFYYLFALNELPFPKRLKKSLIPLCFAVCSLAFMVIKNYLLSGGVIPSMTAFKGKIFIAPFWSYLAYANIFTLHPFLLIFVIPGSIFLAKLGRKKSLLIFLWIWVPFFVFSFIPEKNARYLLIICPPLSVLVSLGIEYLLNTAFSKLPKVKTASSIIVVLCLFLLITHNAKRFNFILQDQIVYGYTGLKEAGILIRNHSQQGDLIIAKSPRIIRKYTQIDYKANGGQIVALPKKREDFLKLVEESKENIILEIDMWGYPLHKWLFPVDGNKIKYFRSLGFEVKKIIRKPGIDNGKLMKRPVVLLLYREKT